MQSLEVSGAVRPLYGSLGVKGLIKYLHACEQNMWEYQNSANMSCFQSVFLETYIHHNM